MILASLERRLARAETRLRHRARGVHRYFDDELAGLIAVLRQADDGGPVDRDREEWATALLDREGLLP